MIHLRPVLSLMCVVTLSQPVCALAATKRMTPEEKACAASRAQVTRFLELDLKGARRAPDIELNNLLDAPESARLRPLAITREKEIVGCVAKNNARLVSVRVRYQVSGIIRQPPEGSSVSLFLPGKGSHDRIYKLSGAKTKFLITNADQIMPHVSPEVAIEELRKELPAAKDDIERGSIQGAIAEIGR